MANDKTEKRDSQPSLADKEENEMLGRFRRQLIRALDYQFRSADNLAMGGEVGPFPELIESSLSFCEYFGWAEEEGTGEPLRWRRGPRYSEIERTMEELENKDKYTRHPNN